MDEDVGQPHHELDAPGVDQLQQPRLRVINGEQIVIDDGPLGGVRPREAIDPLPMPARPVTPRIVQTATQV